MTSEADLSKQEPCELLWDVWLALRGVGIGAPLDMDYAKELADKLKETFSLRPPPYRE